MIVEAHDATLRAVRGIALDKAGHFEKAYGSNSLRAAITAACLKCRMCQVAMIRDCPDLQCPLHRTRPYQNVNPEDAEPLRGEAEVIEHDETTTSL